MATRCPKCHSENPDTKQFCGDCGTQLPSSREVHPAATETLQAAIRELTTGSTFAGRYQIIEELGKGGMGRVYRAIDKKLNEEVAIKLIKPEIAVDRKTLERFHNELKLARKISHRNVGRMYELMEEKDAHFITMEYVPGQDLRGLIRQTGQLTVGKAVSIARQVGEGLAEAHRLGIVHRDLKPSNIIIDKEGNTRIMDFGIARSLKARGITGDGVMIGTPEYMSPEQVEGKEVDQRSDIYSLGIVLYEMLTGQVPFAGDTPFTVGVKQKSEIPRDPKELNAQVPPDLGRLVLKCLEKDKAKRYETAAALNADLERIEQGLPTTERIAAAKKPPTSPEITVRFNLKKMALPGLAVIALVAVIVFLLIFFPQRKPPAGPKIQNSIAVISFVNQTGDPAFDYLQEAIPNLLITNLENTGLFYVATWERMRDILKQMGVKQAGIISSDDGFALCRREGIQAIAIGTFSRAGDIFTTDVKIYDAETKRTLKSANDKGTGVESIFDRQIDNLSRDISVGLGAGMDKVEAAQLNIKDITTHSLEAYKYFLKGKEACGLFYWEEARENLDRALELDSTFAMAYVYLAWSYFDTGPNKAITETIEKARAFADKTSQKDGLYLDALYAYFVKRDAEEAVKILSELTLKYPDEKWALHMSGDFLRENDELTRACAQYEKWFRLDPQDANGIYHLSYINAQLGNLKGAEEYVKMHEAIAPPEWGNLSKQHVMYFRMGQIDKAIAKLKEAQEIYPDAIDPILSFPRLYTLKEDYDEALRWANEIISQASVPDQKMVAYMRRGYIYSLRGTLGDALADFTLLRQMGEEADSWRFKAESQAGKGFVHLVRGEYEASRRSFEDMLRLIGEDDREAYPLYYYELYRAGWAFCTGMLALEQGQIGPADDRLSEFMSLLPKIHPLQEDYYSLLRDLLQGELLLAQGALDKALVAGKRTGGPESPYWDVDGEYYGVYGYYMDLTARIFAEKGEAVQAIAEYERLLEMNYPNGYKYYVYPLYHYRLGLLYETVNEAAKARSKYERFLSLWKDADPGRPEVEDAKKRLAGLKQ